MAPLLSKLKARGCVHDVSHFDGLEAALDKPGLSFYCGFDPTASSLHVGSMLPLLLMRRLQENGHTPIALVGSATGMIGDPSGKSEERKLLDEATLAENVAGIEKQIGLFLNKDGPNGYSLVKNDQWLGGLKYIEFLRDVGKHFSVNAMIAKDSVKSRLENREQGISYTEFSYMLLQAYDFLWLYENKQCALQVGGSDQWGNITAGLELIRRRLHHASPEVYGMTFPLLTTASGTKFGKTEHGTVWLDPARTSPYRFYQFWVNTADADVIRYLKLFTDTAESELAEFEDAQATAPEERKAQVRLAETLTDLIHGPTETARAKTATSVLFGASFDDLDSKTLADIFSDVPSTEVARDSVGGGIGISDLLISSKLADSKASARRLIEGGGVYLNNRRIEDARLSVTREHFIDDSVLVLRSGKKKHHLVKLVG